MAFKLSSGEQMDLLAQVDYEYNAAHECVLDKWNTWTKRLKLYNNQTRDASLATDSLMFSVFQTLFAAFHADRYNVTFEARESGDEEQSENLNRMAEYDFELMKKALLDREWVWDTLFFGRGLVLFMNFDRKLSVPVPQVIDPLSFMRDPMAESVNGDFYGAGAARFMGSQLRITELELKKYGFANIEQVTEANAANQIDENIRLRKEAQGFTTSQDTYSFLGDNKDYKLNRWFTWFQGQRVMVTTANDNKLIVAFHVLKQQDRWPIIDKTFSPIAHSWDGVSVPDLTESQQRHRAVITNAALDMVKDQVSPLYLYDARRIKNPAYLNRDAGKHVPIDGPPQGAVDVAPKDQVRQDAQWIMETLNASAQTATATSEVQQGVISETKRTATELSLMQQRSDTRYTLALKIMGEAERDFWQQYYSLYKINFKEGIDEKVIRLSGSLGAEWRPLTRENIVMEIDPDIRVENRAISEQKRFNELQVFSNFLTQASTDPTFQRRAAMRRYGTLIGLDSDEVRLILPPTSDEILATENNKLLNANKLPTLSMTMDPAVHLEFTKKCNDTKAKRAYEKALMAMMVLKKMQERQLEERQITEGQQPVQEMQEQPKQAVPTADYHNAQPAIA